MKLRGNRLKKNFLYSPQLIQDTVWVELELLPSSSIVKQNWLLVSSSVAYVFFWHLHFNKREGRLVLLYLSSPGFIYTLKILRRTAHLSHSRFFIWGLGILICRFFLLGLQTTCLLRREWSFPLLQWGWNRKSSRRRLCLNFIVPMTWIISNCSSCWEIKSDNEWLQEHLCFFLFYEFTTVYALQAKLSLV